MAVITGNDYDHIDIVDGSTQTRHMIKDASARAEVADLKSALSDIGVQENISPNLLNPSALLPDTALNSDTGATFGASGYKTTDWMPVEEGKYYSAFVYKNSYIQHPYIARVCVYNSSKTFISNLGTISPGGTLNYVTIPVSGAYIRMMIGDNQFNDGTIMVSECDGTNFPDAVVPYGSTYTLNGYTSETEFNALKSTVDQQEAILDIRATPNDEQTGTDNSGYYINGSGKLTTSTSSSYHVVQYAVTKGTEYVVYGQAVALNGSLPLACFGTTAIGDNVATKETIQNGSIIATNYNVPYTPDENGYIFIAYVAGTNKAKLYDSVKDSYRIRELENANKKSIKIQLFGDSITDDVRVSGGTEYNITTWANFIDDYMPEYDVTLVNSAVGGSGIGHGYSGTARYSTKEYNYVHDLVTDGTLDTSADVIVMLTGTNSWRSGYGSIGELGDDTVNTFYGAASLICQAISTNTKAVFFIATPPQRYNAEDQSSPTNELGEVLNAQGKTLKEYCDALKTVAAFYGCPVVDLNDHLGWNKYNVAKFTSDGLHPSASECYRIAEYICGVIKMHLGT